MQLLTRLAFDELDANRVELRIDTRNSAACASPSGSGTSSKGRCDGSYRRLTAIPADMHVLALLPEEYRRSRGSTH